MSAWLQISIEVLTLTFMLFGLFGLVIPVVPGLVIIWVAALGYGIAAGFGTLGWIMFAIISLLMVAGSVIDNVLMGTQARQSGASWVSIAAALVFGLAGNFVLPVIGGLIAALVALFVAEWIRRKNWRESLKSVGGMAWGCGWAFVIRFIMGVVMIGLWMIWAWA
ncbi:MAG: DUF456 domain-containing protein [Anaerolineales bacterium]|nr:DUF456 domain-containing protein [Anaerolineales bacterium]